MQDTLEYEDERFHVEIKVRRVTVRQGLYRQKLYREAWQEEAEKQRGGTMDLEERLIHLMSYPTCLGATISVKNLGDDDLEKLSQDITFEEFLDLPDALVTKWEELAYGANPHWLPTLPTAVGEEAEEEEDPDRKKDEPESTSSSSKASSPGTKRTQTGTS